MTEDGLNAGLLWEQGRHKRAAFREFWRRLDRVRPGWRGAAAGGEGGLAGRGRLRRLLDVGCGTGGFLAAARAEGFEGFGFDACGPEADLARAVHPNVRRAAGLAQYEAALGRPVRADLVTLWDVLEHLRRPHAMLADLAHGLEPGGILFAATPNGRAARLKARLYPRVGRRAGLAPWEHVFYYSPRALGRLVEEAGLGVLWVGPVACYRRGASLFEMVRRIGFAVSAAAAPGLSPQIGVFAEKPAGGCAG
jgi:SAM-dependent methyltransferase